MTSLPYLFTGPEQLMSSQERLQKGSSYYCVALIVAMIGATEIGSPRNIVQLKTGPVLCCMLERLIHNYPPLQGEEWGGPSRKGTGEG